MRAWLKLIDAAHLELGKAKGTGLGAVLLFLLGAGLLGVISLSLAQMPEDAAKPLIDLLKSWGNGA